MQDKTVDIQFDANAHREIARGVEMISKAVASTYGPGGRTVLIKKRYVDPMTTRDGVTVALNIAGPGKKLDTELATMGAKLVYQASNKTAKTAGDGTTATTILMAELYKSGYKQIVAGTDATEVVASLNKDRDTIVKYVESKSKKCDKKMLDQVATISCRDDQLGQMISDLVWDVGADGAINLEYQNAPLVEVDKITGYMFSSGFKDLTARAILGDPTILVTQKPLRSRSDILPLLDLLIKQDNPSVIIGDVSSAAYETLLWALSNDINLEDGSVRRLTCLVVPPPAYGSDGHDYFEDIATYTGARLILESDEFKQVTSAHFGTAKGAIIERHKAVIFGDNKTGDEIAERIKTIKTLMADTDISPSQKEAYEQRLAKLAGKVSILKIGAATDVEREELFFRVEDAVEACKSALSSGVVAGGATTLLFASQLEIERFVSDALQKPFKLLMEHSAEDSGLRKQQILKAGYGKGFNLKAMTDEPTDLNESGVVDPTKVVLQTVKNAFANAGALLTMGTTITEVEEDEATNK
jgi:chaperonin GroEL